MLLLKKQHCTIYKLQQRKCFSHFYQCDTSFCLTNFIFKHYLTFTHSILTMEAAAHHSFQTGITVSGIKLCLLPTYSNNDALKCLTDLFPNVGYKHSRGIVEVVYAFDTSLICCWPMRRDKQAATHSCCAETAKLQTSQDRHEGVTY